MKHLYACFLLFSCLYTPLALAQKTSNNFTVEYQTFDRGRLVDADNPILTIANEKQTLISTLKEFEKKQEAFPSEEFYIDGVKKQSYQLSQLHLKERVGLRHSGVDDSKKYTLSSATKRIQGYLCKRATINIDSDVVELWYTTEIPVKAGPTTVGSSLGLVLEMTRNKEFRISASKINKNIPFDIDSHVKLADTPLFDEPTYSQKIWLSRFITVPVFKDETIHYNTAARSNDSVYRFGAGTVLVRKIKFPAYKRNSQLFLEVSETSLGDPTSRTGSVFIIPTYNAVSFLDALQKGVDILPVYSGGNGRKYPGVHATPTYNPPIELLRFFTPFGIGKFNHISIKDVQWDPSALYRQEISAFAPLLKDREVYIGMYIGTNDPNGHRVSASISIHPNDSQVEEFTFMMPLFNTVNILETQGQEYATMFGADKGLTVEFELENALNNAQLRYITTGQGGWNEGDEFNPRENKIFIDGKLVHTAIPWREDCGSYRLMNPASTAYKNGLSASDLSRSNWCPGTATYPMLIPLGKLSAGKHKIQIKIAQGASQGRNFSYWNVTGVLTGYN
ncbi:GLPGLI family protein [Flavobacterium sp. JP2137]|uniref:GLPGLI family protein n=1 Tax=Flavobacterium sp. JP2137 TaxID=3414510 RepID=UPI003D2FFA3C